MNRMHPEDLRAIVAALMCFGPHEQAIITSSVATGWADDLLAELAKPEPSPMSEACNRPAGIGILPPPSASTTFSLGDRVTMTEEGRKAWVSPDIPQDSNPFGMPGTVVEMPPTSGWVRVKWDNGEYNDYRFREICKVDEKPTDTRCSVCNSSAEWGHEHWCSFGRLESDKLSVVRAQLGQAEVVIADMKQEIDELTNKLAAATAQLEAAEALAKNSQAELGDWFPTVQRIREAIHADPSMTFEGCILALRDRNSELIDQFHDMQVQMFEQLARAKNAEARVKELEAEATRLAKERDEALETMNQRNWSFVALTGKIQELEAQLQTAATTERERWRGLIEELIGCIEVPEPRCSCHISPPCHDCVEFAGLREAIRTIEKELEIK